MSLKNKKMIYRDLKIVEIKLENQVIKTGYVGCIVKDDWHTSFSFSHVDGIQVPDGFFAFCKKNYILHQFAKPGDKVYARINFIQRGENTKW